MGDDGGGLSGDEENDDGAQGDLARRPWTKEEDTLIMKLVHQHGTRKWPLVASKLHARSGKQCRERFKNQLDPNIKKEPWTTAEDLAIVEAQELLGNKVQTFRRPFTPSSSPAACSVCPKFFTPTHKADAPPRPLAFPVDGDRQADAWEDRQLDQKSLELHAVKEAGSGLLTAAPLNHGADRSGLGSLGWQLCWALEHAPSPTISLLWHPPPRHLSASCIRPAAPCRECPPATSQCVPQRGRAPGKITPFFLAGGVFSDGALPHVSCPMLASEG